MGFAHTEMLFPQDRVHDLQRFPVILKCSEIIFLCLLLFFLFLTFYTATLVVHTEIIVGLSCFIVLFTQSSAADFQCHFEIGKFFIRLPESTIGIRYSMVTVCNIFVQFTIASPEAVLQCPFCIVQSLFMLTQPETDVTEHQIKPVDRSAVISIKLFPDLQRLLCVFFCILEFLQRNKQLCQLFFCKRTVFRTGHILHIKLMRFTQQVPGFLILICRQEENPDMQIQLCCQRV